MAYAVADLERERLRAARRVARRRLGCWLGLINQLCVTAVLYRSSADAKAMAIMAVAQIAPARCRFRLSLAAFCSDVPGGVLLRPRRGFGRFRGARLPVASASAQISEGLIRGHHGTLRDTADARAHIPMNAVDPASWFATRRRTQRARAGLSSYFCKGCARPLARARAVPGPTARHGLLRHRAKTP